MGNKLSYYKTLEPITITKQVPTDYCNLTFPH
jgi:hypothetical protein